MCSLRWAGAHWGIAARLGNCRMAGASFQELPVTCRSSAYAALPQAPSFLAQNFHGHHRNIRHAELTALPRLLVRKLPFLHTGVKQDWGPSGCTSWPPCCQLGPSVCVASTSVASCAFSQEGCGCATNDCLPPYVSVLQGMDLDVQLAV